MQWPANAHEILSLDPENASVTEQPCSGHRNHGIQTKSLLTQPGHRLQELRKQSEPRGQADRTDATITASGCVTTSHKYLHCTTAG